MTAQAAVLTAVVGGTVAYAHRATSVTLIVDGTSRTVQASAEDVRGLLFDEAVPVGRHDVVEPGLDTPLHAGELVVVRPARPLRLTVDGTPGTYWTIEDTVADALAALGVRVDGARLSVSRATVLGRSGLDVVVSHRKSVTILADGRLRDVRTTAVDVAQLLAENAVRTSPADQLSVLPTSPVVDGLVVAVTRIERRRVTVTEPLAPATVRRTGPDLDPGTTRVLAPGRPGVARAVYEVVLADGHPAGRTRLSAVVLRRPVARVLSVGPPRPAPPTDRPRSVPGVDGLNWTALAQCESGGNPRAVNSAGYYGLYQFSPSTWQAVGGSGLPSQAAADEQLYRAKLLFKRSGAGQWGCGHHLYDG